MSSPSGTGQQFAEDAERNIKWHQKSKKSRIQITSFFVGLSVFCFWNFGYVETFELLGICAGLHYVIKLFGEIKTWFKK